jgi:hypothetical protein
MDDSIIEEGMTAKPEIRIPKSEGNPKSEIRKDASQHIGASDFGFRASFGFRISDFGFKPALLSPCRRDGFPHPLMLWPNELSQTC